MKTGWKSAVVGLALAVGVFGGPISPRAEKSVTGAEKQWQQAVLSGDVATLGKLMADDISYTHSSSLTQTKAQFIESIGKTGYQGIDFKTTEMRQYGDAVVVIHEAVITTALTGVTHLYLTHVWSGGRNGQWQMVSRQATKIPEAAK